VLGLTAAAVLAAVAAPAAAQDPGAPVPDSAVVQAAPDHFTETFADPVDYANPEDQLLIAAATQNAAPAMADGQLRWERRQTMDIAPVFAGYGPSALAAGREGLAAPVDAARHTTASFRLYSANRSAGAILWDRCGPDRGRCGGETGFDVLPGWHTYRVPLVARSGEPWAPPVIEVRLTIAGDGDPVPTALDWFRLHADGPGVTVRWSGQRLYWDADDDRANNAPDRPGWGLLAEGGGTAVFPAASYPDGVYRFHADDGPSSAPLTVTAPVPDFLEPDARGGEDYATAVRGDAWDLDQPGDVALLGNATDVRYEGGALRAVNGGPSLGDPFLFLAMGAPLDAARYHRLTVRTTLEGAFDLGFGPGGGSHGRLLWDAGDGGQLVDSKELVVYPGVGEYVVDLATDPPTDVVENERPGRPGWVGNILRLRYDPNEDPGPRRWTVEEIALRADDRTAGDAFEVVWRDTAPASVALFADTDRAGFDGRLLVAGLEQQPGENRWRWDTREFPAGRYQLYAVGERAGTTGRRYAGGPVVVDPRLAGPDRIATAVRLSRAAHPEGARAAVVVSGRDFADALAAAPLAAAVGGPLLLNDPGALAPAVAAELDRLGAGTVHLVGGPAAQSPAVEDALRARGTVVRVAGPDRFATAAAAAAAAVDVWRADGDTGAGARVLVASGADFPDALAAGPLAAAARAPLLLTAPGAVPPATAAALAELDPDRVTVLGGPGAVAETTAAALDADERLGGADRSATAAVLADAAAAAGADPADIVVASGRAFPDALAAGPLAAARGGVLLLTEPAAVPPATADALRARAAGLTWLRVAGGPAAVPDATTDALLRAAGR